MTHFLTTERPTPDIVVSNDKGNSVDSGPYIPYETEMLAGRRIDETTVPKPSWLPTRGVCTSAHISLPDAYHVAGYCCVSQRFKAIIERYDPDVHQFFPLTTTSKKLLFEEVTLFNACTLKDTIDTEASGFQFTIVKGKRFAVSKVDRRTLRVLRPTSHQPGHVWREDLCPSELYISDEVFKAALKSGITGMRVSYVVKITDGE